MTKKPKEKKVGKDQESLNRDKLKKNKNEEEQDQQADKEKGSYYMFVEDPGHPDDIAHSRDNGKRLSDINIVSQKTNNK